MYWDGGTGGGIRQRGKKRKHTKGRRQGGTLREASSPLLHLAVVGRLQLHHLPCDAIQHQHWVRDGEGGCGKNGCTWTRGSEGGGEGGEGGRRLSARVEPSSTTLSLVTQLFLRNQPQGGLTLHNEGRSSEAGGRGTGGRAQEGKTAGGRGKGAHTVGWLGPSIRGSVRGTHGNAQWSHCAWEGHFSQEVPIAAGTKKKCWGAGRVQTGCIGEE